MDCMATLWKDLHLKLPCRLRESSVLKQSCFLNSSSLGKQFSPMQETTEPGTFKAL